MSKRLFSVIAVAGLMVSLSVLAGCKQEVPPSQQAATVTAPVKATAAADEVAKVVFVGKQNACDCTRKRVEASWAALQEALGTPTRVPVGRLRVDTEGSKVEPYRKQRPMVALPAIYFVDGENVVLELLQGEVTKQQIVAALKSKRSAP